MRYKKDTTNERLRGIPFKDRVFIYNASIILEFLNQTFMPTYYFLTPEGQKDMEAGKDLKKLHFKNPESFDKDRMTLGDIFDLYKMFREQQSFTNPIESRYKLSVILKKLSYIKNGWKFAVKRVGAAQMIYFSPVKIRIHVDLEERKNFPPAKMNLEEGQIEVKKEDHEETIPHYTEEVKVTSEQLEEIDPRSPDY